MSLIQLQHLASCQFSSIVEHSSRIVSRFICPVSSAVERFVDIEEVSGSTPLSDTKIVESCQSGLLAHLGKVMVAKAAQGFNSLTLCQFGV